MKATLFHVLIFIISIASVNGQASEPLLIGTSLKLQSEVLEETREIQIYLPPSYEEGSKEYPVLYVLDGQRFFLYAVSLQQSFAQFRLTPECIVVGINNRYPNRFRHFSSRKEAFSRFINDEVKTAVNNSYRTSGEEILFGWEYGGSFALNGIFTNPTEYEAILAASPFPTRHLADSLKRAGNQSISEVNLFITVSPGEHSVNEQLDVFMDELRNSEELLNWDYQILQNEEHRSTPYHTLYYGLKQYFFYYPELQVDELEDFLELGGIEYAKDYSIKRAAQYGFEAEMSTWTKFTILRSAIRADNPNMFSLFEKELVTPQFLADLSESRRRLITDYKEGIKE